MAMNTKTIFLSVVAVVVLVAVGYLLYSNMYMSKSSMTDMRSNMLAPMYMPVENFTDIGAPADQVQVSSGMETQTPTQMSTNNVDASENIQFVEQPQGVRQYDSGVEMNQLPSECYPKNVLSSADLLPADANSLYAQVNPSGQGSLADQNFLTAGFHIGINTVGQTLRNANRQLRSEPLNPQVKVSPWMQTTIEPDINRKPLEIGSGDL